MRRSVVRALPIMIAFLGGKADASSLLFENTHFVSVTQRTLFSQTVANFGSGGYELANGRYQSFQNWYQPQMIDVEFQFLTQLTQNFGILWGFSTGEFGEKYRVDPAFRIGAIVQHQITPQSVLSLSGSVLFGGALNEKSCVANYGDIGGIQEVNCRLAASTLSPSATLQYLANARPNDWGRATLSYRISF